MDLSCNIWKQNAVCGSERTYYKTLDQFGPSNVLRSRILDAKLTGGSTVAYKVPKKRNRVVASSNSNHLTLICASKFDGALQIFKHKRFLNCNNKRIEGNMGMVHSECQSNDSLAFIDGNGRNVEYNGDEGSSSGPTDGAGSAGSKEAGGEAEAIETDAPTVDELRELLQKAMKELEVARLNSTMFEEKAQKISEAAIALQDEAAHAWNDVNCTLDSVQQIVNEEYAAKEAVQKATMALSLAEARLQVAIESLELAKGENSSPETSIDSKGEIDGKGDQEVLLVAQEDIKECRSNLETCDAELKRLQSKKEELQKEVDRLNELAEKSQLKALKAEEDVTNIMLLAEQAVAFELEAAQRVSDTEIALQKVEKSSSNSFVDTLETTQGSNVIEEVANEDNKAVLEISGDIAVEMDRDLPLSVDSLALKSISSSFSDFEDSDQTYDLSDSENGKLSSDSSKEVESGAEKSILSQAKKQETQKDLTREGSPSNSPKPLLKKSSRFFSASFFSFAVDGTEFTPALVFQGLLDSMKMHLPKLVVGAVLLGAGYAPIYSLSFMHSFPKECEGP